MHCDQLISETMEIESLAEEEVYQMQPRLRQHWRFMAAVFGATGLLLLLGTWNVLVPAGTAHIGKNLTRGIPEIIEKDSRSGEKSCIDHCYQKFGPETQCLSSCYKDYHPKAAAAEALAQALEPVQNSGGVAAVRHAMRQDPQIASAREARREQIKREEKQNPECLWIFCW